MIPLAEVALLAVDHGDEARLCVRCGEDSTEWGLWLDESWVTGPQVGVTAWCDKPECQQDREATKALTAPVASAPDMPDEVVREVIGDVIADHPMWVGDDGQPLDYSPEREARIANFADEVARRIENKVRET